ncbi:DUF1887 family protein [Arsukibacterium sp. MJ3]|uniref:DUF1887 family protein n=1 Tax=Arsukibacterium sp. MJ3 TaxID=1632859 RepID=UPI00128D289E|nr:DUF1887 family protein [Arsukibacterium sp. MJ3]
MPKPIALLIPISEHNIAQLYNCLTTKADAVVLMASSHFATSRSRFCTVLNALQPGITIIELDLPEDAENYMALHHFALHHLQPLSTTYQLELNGTGGTKVIPLAFIDSVTIGKVYYKGQQHTHLQCWQPGKPNSYHELALHAPISADKALALYVSKTVPGNPRANPFEQDKTALCLAASMWQQYADPTSPMHWLAAQLAQSAWADKTNPSTSVNLTIPPEQLNNPDWQAWFQGLSTFSQAQLVLVQNSIVVQNSHRTASLAYQFKRWLSGDWLEQLVQSWLREQFAADQLLCGVKPSGSGEQGDSRELDFICFHNTAGYVIETKVTTEPGQSANKMVQQLISLAENFGKLRKVLLLSPLFFQQKPDAHALEQFKKYCKGHNVTLCHDKNSLLSLFK